ncbi:MAG: 30S ribosomal protein S16 [Bdellovibrionota bacterium]|nr:MAG: 30S ribosomal protein S16 [Pseudomonadota bacterium]
MLTLRLQRHGSTHRPFYHIVATDSRNARDGKFLEKLGYYDPKAEPSIIELKVDRANYWYERGAEVSTAVASIFRAKKIKLERAKTHKK